MKIVEKHISIQIFHTIFFNKIINKKEVKNELH